MFKTTEIYSHSSEGQESEIQVWSELIPSGGSEGEAIPCLSPLASGDCKQSLAFLGLFVGILLQSAFLSHGYLCWVFISSITFISYVIFIHSFIYYMYM